MTIPKTPMGHYPKCPPRDHFPLITGFTTPGSDFPRPHPLDAGISMDVFDPTEIVSPGQYERIRVVETDDPFLVEVNWCVCGAFAEGLSGCWELNLYLDDVDGEGKSSGRLHPTVTVDVDSANPVPVSDDVTKRCYSLPVTIPGKRVTVGAYSLLVIITLRRGTCAKPGPRLVDYLGYAQIPVLVFVPPEPARP